jgi:hypothetical protein
MSIDGNNNNGHGFSLTEHFQKPLTLWRTFPGASNVRVGFPFRLYLSEDHANRREALIGANQDEKAAIFRGYKSGIMCDALAAPPIVIKLEPIAYKAGTPPEEMTEKFKELPPVELADFPPAGNLPPDATEEVKRADMRRRAEAFFNKRDGQGNQILWFLVESLFSEYWERALPDLFRPPDKNIDPAIVLSSKPLG